ncbi:hypothetical protein COT83_02605 [Candidatus Peregrinibacteria bacterium CG10_big_fil_rev_8_21_14_0_10_44_7]|nr:MAG: hypothetical protein COT83_02605 [Candidatus Peregrinibacteria bacterium CG10_big_fil_rev_8_21_14_0_10_44_7]PJB89001.1 MAG: hypothetical protein CO082_02555 [Candidatus Peregrinibacteria bacterium CG_4_9_14_0_8_um_filter_44_15]
MLRCLCQIFFKSSAKGDNASQDDKFERKCGRVMKAYQVGYVKELLANLQPKSSSCSSYKVFAEDSLIKALLNSAKYVKNTQHLSDAG